MLAEGASSLSSLELFLVGQKSEPVLVGARVRRIGAGCASPSTSFEPQKDELEREASTMSLLSLKL